MEKQSMHAGSRGEWLVAIQMVFVVLYLLIPEWPNLQSTDLFAHLAMLRWALLISGMVIAAVLGVGGSLNLREYITPLPYPVDHSKLVDTGVYALVRHPLYSSQLFAAAGWAAYSLSLSHLLVTIAAALFFNYKASKEEAWLTERHPEYREYATRVGKFFPGLGRLKK